MERIGREIERELARSGGGATAVVSSILAVWRRAVGEAVSRNAWPLRVSRDGTLHVATTSATWAFELDRLAPDIVERLRELLGDEAPAALRFRPGPVPEPPPVTPAAGGAGGAPETPPEVAAEAAGAAAAIADPELRDLVERAARASLAKARSGRRT